MQSGDLISGKYRLLRLLGSGGMGSVWAARNELTDRDFAIKFLLPDLAQNKEALSRFFHEAKACGQIKHPAVVDVYDMGTAENGAPFLVMELLEGEGFDSRLTRSRVFRPAEAAAWISFVARGLEEAHTRGLVHRDLKPGNIFFAIDDRGDVVPKLLDFGVSKWTNQADQDFVKTTTGAVLGSPAYMSPEQAKGETDIDSRSDIWSLGVILYEALTGKVPFDAPNYNALMVAIMMTPHRPVAEIGEQVPDTLSEIVDAAMAKDRDVRIGTARELADRLDQVVMQITGSAFPGLSPPAYQARTGKYPAVAAPEPSAPRPPMSTTQGPWSEAQSLRGARKRAQSPLFWMSAGVLSVTVLIVAILAVTQTRTPLVAVAGRASLALQGGLSRLQEQLASIEATGVASPSETDPAPKSSAGLTIAPDDLPPADRPRVRVPTPTKKADPHGGVDNAGF